MTTPTPDLFTTRLGRRAFGQRAARWSLAGTVALIAAACGGSAATKEEVTALEDDLKSLQLEVRRLRGGSTAATDAHGSTSAAADTHGTTAAADAHGTTTTAATSGGHGDVAQIGRAHV